jgi:methylenetetrahydrofolate dehydrogenase (NADP+)/methenyltetrahydrofolate cyclohydrolase
VLILDGKRVSDSVRAAIKVEVKNFTSETGRPPGLAVVIVGKDPASQVYVKNKIKACEDVGIRSLHIELDGQISQEALLKQIQNLNDDTQVDGILVQLPLPEQLNKEEVFKAISPKKDADGLTRENREWLEAGQPRVVPCTPAGVMEILKFYKIEVKNKAAVVVGRSAIVGHPMAVLLKNAGAQVEVVHSKTVDPNSVTQRADIIVVAAGRPGLIGKAQLKEGVTVIDVGIHRTELGLIGDVRFHELRDYAYAVTPVPGGVGPMTITMLLKNTLSLARAHV